MAEGKKRGRPARRFVIRSTSPNRGHVTSRTADSVVEAWDWFAYFTATAPLNEVEIIDREQDVEARA